MTKPYNKSLINLVCSVCRGKYCLWFLSHRPRSFIARSVRKTSGNIFPYRPRTRLISPYYLLSGLTVSKRKKSWNYNRVERFFWKSFSRTSLIYFSCSFPSPLNNVDYILTAQTFGIQKSLSCCTTQSSDFVD